jgi:serine phosphatase RsbU (regulator of sigma subunit)
LSVEPGLSLHSGIARSATDFYLADPGHSITGAVEWIVDGGISELHLPGGVPLGVQKGATFRKSEIVLENGQSVLLFTDGLVEAENETGEQFAKDRLMDFLNRCEGPPWGKNVLQHIEAWRGRCAANDDLTILEVWRDQTQSGPDYDI